jgi:hypothetical protein
MLQFKLSPDSVRGILGNWRGSPAEQNISIGSETCTRGVSLYKCFHTTSRCSLRCSLSATTITATPFNTCCSTSRLRSSSATTPCLSWITTTSVTSTCPCFATTSCRNRFFSPDSGSVVRSYMPRPATAKEQARSAAEPCLQFDTNLLAATTGAQQIPDLHIEEGRCGATCGRWRQDLSF